MPKGKRNRGERVRVQVGDVEVRLRLPAGSQGASLPVEEWLPFSPTEGRILVLLLASKAMSREEIALALEESVDGRIKGILATLVGRKVLLIASEGYSVNCPENRRKSLLSWFTEPEEEVGGPKEK